jgi:hypothetical protein
MQLLTLDEAMARNPRYYRVTVLAQWSLTVVFGGIVGWICWLALQAGAKGALFRGMMIWMALWLGLFWWLMLNDLRKALKPTAWLAATDDSGLFIKWRSYQNLRWGLGGRQVLFLPWREIRRAHRVDQTVITSPRRSGGRRYATKQFVELEVAPRVDLTELRTILANERDGRPDGVKQNTKWGHFPVSVEGDSTIRVEWRARPNLKHFIEEAAVWVEIDAPEEGTIDASSPTVSDDDLRELARQGELMSLMAALRRRDGLSLEEAKERAESMMADAPNDASKDASAHGGSDVQGS